MTVKELKGILPRCSRPIMPSGRLCIPDWSLASAVRDLGDDLRQQSLWLMGPLSALGAHFHQKVVDRREGRGEYGWSMACVGCGVDMPISRTHARMVFSLAMRTESKPQPRCPKCAAQHMRLKT